MFMVVIKLAILYIVSTIVVCICYQGACYACINCNMDTGGLPDITEELYISYNMGTGSLPDIRQTPRAHITTDM